MATSKLCAPKEKGVGQLVLIPGLGDTSDTSFFTSAYRKRTNLQKDKSVVLHIKDVAKDPSHPSCRYEKVIPAPETYERNFIGQLVTFRGSLWKQSNGIRRDRGRVIEQKYLGRTKRGSIPEYELIVQSLRNQDKTIPIRLVDDYVHFE